MAFLLLCRSFTTFINLLPDILLFWWDFKLYFFYNFLPNFLFVFRTAAYIIYYV